MTAVTIIAGVLALGVMGYLFYMLFKGDKREKRKNGKKRRRHYMRELIGKKVRLVFLTGAFQGGGVAAATYTLLEIQEGFAKVCDDKNRVMYYNLSQIKRISEAEEARREGGEAL